MKTDQAKYIEPKSKEGLLEICGSVVRWSDIEKAWKSHLKLAKALQECKNIIEAEAYKGNINLDLYPSTLTNAKQVLKEAGLSE